MPAQWRISHWPGCEKHVFLTHCREDRHELVVPVYQELERRGVLPWIDRYHYPSGRDGLGTLRDQLLRCRHVAYFITPAMLRQGRGWANAERAFAATIQQNLYYGGDEIAHVEIPLLFVPPTDSIFLRSVWRSLIDEASSCPHAMPPASTCRRLLGSDNGFRRWGTKHVQWAADAIEGFIRQEQEWGLDWAIRFGQDPRLRGRFNYEQNLRRRVLAEAPPPLP